MVEDNPLDLENIKEKQHEDYDLYQSNDVCERMIHNNRKYPKDKIHGGTLPNICGHIAKYMGAHCQIYGDILPNIWGHIAKYMGTHCQYKIHGDRLLIQKNINGISLITMHGMRAGVHSNLGSSPGNILFNRDMFLNIYSIADWHAIIQRREHLIHEKLMRENQKRRDYNYAPQQMGLEKKWKPKKLGKRTSGPYKIVQVHVNGTVTIQLRPGLTERINIMQIIPYKQ
jgi:hypothetical protein